MDEKMKNLTDTLDKHPDMTTKELHEVMDLCLQMADKMDDKSSKKDEPKPVKKSRWGFLRNIIYKLTGI